MLQVPVNLANPPAHEYVVQATVPMLQDGLTLQLDDYPSESRVIAHAKEWTIYEVCALAAPLDGSFVAHVGPQTTVDRLTQHRQVAETWGAIQLELADANGSQLFSLTGRAIRSVHRDGKLYRQTFHHFGLGRFGFAHLWIGMRANTNQLDFILQIHNGIPGPDRRISWAKIVSPWPMHPELPDPAFQPPYIIKPGNYIIPQQFGRPFRFSVGLREPERVAIANWSQGGFLPPAWPVPPMSYQHPLADARTRLASVQPSPSWGSIPTGPLWPASGVTQPNEGGGQDRFPMLGVRWAAGNPALEYYRIEQLRTQSRARRRYELDGSALRVPAFDTWNYYDGFLQGDDYPWEWDRWAPIQVPNDPRTFEITGISSLVRELNDNLALVWIANDPLAKLYVLESASRAKLNFPTLDPPAQVGLGTQWDSSYPQAALAIAAARCLGATQYEGWISAYKTHLRLAQMPSGIFEAHLGGYPSQNPPFFDGYLLAMGEDQAMFMLTLYEFGGSDDVLRAAAHGCLVLGTDDDDPGFYYAFPTGPMDGSSVRYLTEDDWPTALHDAMGFEGTSGYYTAWAFGYAIAASVSVGSPDAQELFDRFVFGDDIHSWGLEAPSEQTDAPIDNWYPLLFMFP